jgi:hypothetical protein
MAGEFAGVNRQAAQRARGPERISLRDAAASVASPVRGPVARVLALQRTVGNRAVNRMIEHMIQRQDDGDQDPDAPTGAVQASAGSGAGGTVENFWGLISGDGYVGTDPKVPKRLYLAFGNGKLERASIKDDKGNPVDDQAFGIKDGGVQVSGNKWSS